MTTPEWFGVVAPLAVVQFLLATWVKARLESSVRHEYDEKLEQIRFQSRMREQAVTVAELLAEFQGGAADKTRLNRLSWEASLWLPKPLLEELAKTLCRRPEAKDPKEVVVLVRKHIRGEDDGVKLTDIVHFP